MEVRTVILSIYCWSKNVGPNMYASCQGMETIIGMIYFHQTVNHTESVVDPITGAHTQTIESFWQAYKMQNKHQCDRHRCLVNNCFWEFVWERRHWNTNSLYSFNWGMRLNEYRPSGLLAQEHWDWFNPPRHMLLFLVVYIRPMTFLSKLVLLFTQEVKFSASSSTNCRW